MKIVYISLTGKIASFLKKAGYPDIMRIETGEEKISEDYILMCGTVGMGEIHTHLVQFLKNNHHHLTGVIGSGNKNWGQMYNKAPLDIAKKYDVPVLMLFESAGNSHDVDKFNKMMEEFI